MITPVLPKDRYAELFWSVGKYVSIVNVYICSISGKMLTLEDLKIRINVQLEVEDEYKMNNGN